MVGGKIAVAQILLQTSSTSIIGSMITDERVSYYEQQDVNLVTPILLSDAAVSFTAASLTHALLSDNKARIAKLTVTGSIFIAKTATGGDGSVRGGFSDDAVTCLANENVKIDIVADHQIATDNNVYTRNSNSFEVLLDGSFNFWFAGTDGGAHIGTNKLKIYLDGYK